MDSVKRRFFYCIDLETKIAFEDFFRNFEFLKMFCFLVKENSTSKMTKLVKKVVEINFK